MAPGSASIAQDEWGNLRGRFVYDGDPPPAKRISVFQDAEELGETIEDESLVVNKRNHGIANVIVFLDPTPGEPVPIHPSYDATTASKVELTIQHGRYSPHVTLIRTTQTLVQQNKDRFGYSSMISFNRNTAVNVLLQRSSVVELRLQHEESLPVPVHCAIHPWLSGLVLVRSTPYMVTSDANGRFEINYLPVGKHKFCVWHERIGYVRNTRIGEQWTDSRGRFEVTVKAGEIDWREVRLSPKQFAIGK